MIIDSLLNPNALVAAMKSINSFILELKTNLILVTPLVFFFFFLFYHSVCLETFIFVDFYF